MEEDLISLNLFYDRHLCKNRKFQVTIDLIFPKSIMSSILIEFPSISSYFTKEILTTPTKINLWFNLLK